MAVHNHPPYEPVCNERTTLAGQLRGACLADDGTPRIADTSPARSHQPAYLDPVRHELHQLRAKVARVEQVAAQVERDDSDHLNTYGQHLPGSVVTVAEMIRSALADKEPTP